MISIAISAARLAPVAKTALIKGAPIAKDLGYGIAGAIALNEVIRFGVKRRGATTERGINLERFEVKKPLWKKVTFTKHDETLGDNLARRSRIFWDIACFGAGDVVATLDFFVIKVVKLALFITGKVVSLAVAAVATTGISLWFAVSNMTINKLAALVQTTYAWVDQIAMAPFRGVRVIDRKTYALAWSLLKRRSWRTAAEQQPSNVISIDSLVKDGEVVETRPMADIHHLVVLLTHVEAEAKTDPKAYGANLFAKVLEHGDEAVADYRGNHLITDLQKLGLDAKTVTLATRGFDEARKNASDPATS